VKTLLRWIAPRVKAPAGRVLLAAVYGMLELYGALETGRTAYKVIKEVRRARHKNMR
jgi:hypothetical protein